MPSKSAPFTLVDPISIPYWWSPPPGPKGLFRPPFIAIAGLRQQEEYKP